MSDSTKMTRAQTVKRLDEHASRETRARMALQAIELVNDCVLAGKEDVGADDAAIATSTLAQVAMLALRGEP